MTYRGRVAGEQVTLHVDPAALRIGDTQLAWTDLDLFEPNGHAVRLLTATGSELSVTHLATARDAFVAEALEARSRARRAALLQWTGDRALETFDGKRADERVTVCVFSDGITVEPVNGVPDMLPLSCLVTVERDGYDLRLRARGLPDLAVRHLGRRTDEFELTVERAMVALARRTSDSYAELDPALTALPAADGWAIDAGATGGLWDALRSAVSGHRRAAEIDALERLAGDRLRLGIKAGPSGTAMPFALAPVGGRVAVEATDADDRATFVFATDDVDRLNAVLLVTSFRREALYLPDDRLGRWALAVRTLPVVRWARAALVARIVHNDAWEQAVTHALSRSEGGP